MYPRKAVLLGLGVGILYLVLSLIVPVSRAGLLASFMQFYVYVSLAVLLASFFTRFILNETKYEELFRHSYNAICIVDRVTHTIIEMNPRFQEVMGTGDRKAGAFRLEDLFTDTVPFPLPDPQRGEQETGYKEISIKKADGTERNFLINFRALARRDAEGDITGYVGTIVDITDRKRYEEALKSSLDEKSLLIMEVHHRVKNNLQIISGLIRLQAREITTNEQALAALHECESRVITMALVHESLYQSGNLTNINAKQHITNLVNTLVMSDNHELHIDMNIDVDDMSLDMNTAVPASLIINELVINSLKHAFVGRNHGTIRISFHREPDNMLALIVSDDGVGIPPNMNINETRSLGLKLVTRLVRDQLKGSFTIQSDKGTSFGMQFPSAPATASATFEGKGGNNAG
jgi:PAS domain S-box-containing protein